MAWQSAMASSFTSVPPRVGTGDLVYRPPGRVDSAARHGATRSAVTTNCSGNETTHRARRLTSITENTTLYRRKAPRTRPLNTLVTNRTVTYSEADPEHANSCSGSLAPHMPCITILPMFFLNQTLWVAIPFSFARRSEGRLHQNKRLANQSPASILCYLRFCFHARAVIAKGNPKVTKDEGLAHKTEGNGH